MGNNVSKNWICWYLKTFRLHLKIRCRISLTLRVDHGYDCQNQNTTTAGPDTPFLHFAFWFCKHYNATYIVDRFVRLEPVNYCM